MVSNIKELTLQSIVAKEFYIKLNGDEIKFCPSTDRSIASLLDRKVLAQKLR